MSSELHELETIPGPVPVEKGERGSEVHRSRRRMALPIISLMESSGRQGLLKFFLVDANGDEWYNKSDIDDATGIARNTIGRNIDILVRMNIVHVDEEYGYERYKPALDSPQFRALLETNDLLLQALDES